MRLSQYALMLHLRKTFIAARRLEMGLAGWEGLYQAEMEELGILNIQDQVSKSQVKERCGEQQDL